MQVASLSRKIAGTLAAFALCASSTGALAASGPLAGAPSISPFVALSALGSDASRAALCGSAAAAAVGAAAAAQATPGQGCVLPVVDAPPPAPVAEAAPPPPPPPEVIPAAAPSFGALPLLLGLAAILGAAVLLGNGDKDGNIGLTPIST